MEQPVAPSGANKGPGGPTANLGSAPSAPGVAAPGSGLAHGSSVLPRKRGKATVSSDRHNSNPRKHKREVGRVYKQKKSNPSANIVSDLIGTLSDKGGEIQALREKNRELKEQIAALEAGSVPAAPAPPPPQPPHVGGFFPRGQPSLVKPLNPATDPVADDAVISTLKSRRHMVKWVDTDPMKVDIRRPWVGWSILLFLMFVSYCLWCDWPVDYQYDMGEYLFFTVYGILFDVQFLGKIFFWIFTGLLFVNVNIVRALEDWKLHKMTIHEVIDEGLDASFNPEWRMFGLDLRPDNFSTVDIKHVDPGLQECRYWRTIRYCTKKSDGTWEPFEFGRVMELVMSISFVSVLTLSPEKDKSSKTLTYSKEAVAQLSSLANYGNRTSDNDAYLKLEHCAKHLQTINWNRYLSLEGLSVQQDSVFIAYAFFKQMKYERNLLPFPNPLD